MCCNRFERLGEEVGEFGPGNPSLNVNVERASSGIKMNKRVRTSTSGNSMRVITNSRCLADELHLKYSDQQVQKTEVARSVKKLGSIGRSIGYSQECFSLEGSMYKSVAKELKMRHRNAVPILMLQAGATVSNSHLADQWHEPEIAAGERLEAWDDLAGLSLDPKRSS